MNSYQLVNMDWNKEDIAKRPFLYYKLESDSRALSGFHAYCHIACHKYPSLSEDQKITYILATSDIEVPDVTDVTKENTLPDGYDTSDFESLATVIGWWKRFNPEVKDTWKERAKKLNDRPLTGQFSELPPKLASLGLHFTQELVKDSLRVDLLLLAKSIKQDICNRNKGDFVKKVVRIPHYIQVEEQVFF